MLRRGIKPPDFRSREDHDERPVRPARREKSSSSVYIRDPSCPSPGARSKEPKRVRDSLLELMCDHEFHPARELEEALPEGEWIRAMRELLFLHFAFDRLADSFRIRPSFPGERRQSLVDLLAHIDMTSLRSFPITSRKIVVHEEVLGESSEGMTFDPTANQENEPDEGERLIVAENPEDLTLSAIDSAVMTAAILAKKSSGKSYLGMVLVEEFISCPGLRVPVVVIDPTGAWYGLLATADGKPSSFRIMILGGPHGVHLITRKQGAQAAEIVHEIWPGSVILDLSYMIPAEQHEFVADFGQRLFVLNVRSPLHLIVDEADEFAPQNLDSSRGTRSGRGRSWIGLSGGAGSRVSGPR